MLLFVWKLTVSFLSPHRRTLRWCVTWWAVWRTQSRTPLSCWGPWCACGPTRASRSASAAPGSTSSMTPRNSTSSLPSYWSKNTETLFIFLHVACFIPDHTCSISFPVRLVLFCLLFWVQSMQDTQSKNLSIKSKINQDLFRNCKNWDKSLKRNRKGRYLFRKDISGCLNLGSVQQELLCSVCGKCHIKDWCSLPVLLRPAELHAASSQSGERAGVTWSDHSDLKPPRFTVT